VVRLTSGDVACWVLTTAGDVAVGEGTRCLRPSYRLGLMAPGQPCLLWRSGRHHPGVHALGVLTGPVRQDDGGPVVPVRFTPLAEPVPRVPASIGPAAGARPELASGGRGSGVLTPSWLTAAQYAVVLARTGPARLGP
jgi:hypothetical protein